MFTFDETFWSNAFFTLLNLLILYCILKKFLFKPVTNFIDNRNNKIQETIDAANATRAEVDELKLQYQEQLRGAGEEGKKIIEEQKITCLMVTHNMQQALDLGNRLLMMDSGRIVFDVKDEEKKKMTTADLLEQFKIHAGKSLDNDRILLSGVSET